MSDFQIIEVLETPEMTGNMEFAGSDAEPVEIVFEETGEDFSDLPSPEESSALIDATDLEIPGAKESDVDDGRSRIPGSDYYEDDADDEPVEEEEETTWKDDNDTGKFSEFLIRMYGEIPKHTGTSISGAERALTYLSGLNSEISKAIRIDSDNLLDVDLIEDYRVKIMKDIVTLKNHIKKLEKKIRGSKKSASEEVEEEKIVKAEANDSSLKKEGSLPRATLIMTPFERAIAGILINSVVSAGHPFEEVYEFLRKKYKLDSREELAILQLVMDMGFPIFKDRGTIGEDDKKEEEGGNGIDFIKNYFA